MARRNSNPPPAPFPEDIDRNHFASWITGLTDGEGCFFLAFANRGEKKNRPTPFAHFKISLRCDDTRLSLVHSFWQCGYMYSGFSSGTAEGSKPYIIFTVRKTIDLVRVVIPHFEKHPLILKKARDFQVWKEGVAFLHGISSRVVGSRRKWFPEELAAFGCFVDKLHEVREFQSQAQPIVQLPAPHPSLFT